LFDFIIFILSTYLVELFLGLPLLISVVAFSLPLLALSYVINISMSLKLDGKEQS